MFQWLANRRRKKLASYPFPAAWEETLQNNVTFYRGLNETSRTKMRSLIQIFIAEKRWEGCGGLELTDEIRVTISALACILILELPHNFYENVESIIVYPSTVVPPQRKPGFFESVLAPLEVEHPIIGQAFRQGPLILVWDAVLHDSRHPETGHNVVYHEFAHKLDMQDGAADGTPPLRNRAEYRDWVRTFSREFLRLRREVKEGSPTFLDAYGTVSEAEFFAVATEQFFDRPDLMIRHSPDIYCALKEYYRQDPVKYLIPASADA